MLFYFKIIKLFNNNEDSETIKNFICSVNKIIVVIKSNLKNVLTIKRNKKYIILIMKIPF